MNTDREMLIRMEGKIERMLDGQVRAATDHQYLRDRVQDHGGRLGLLEASENFKKGERQGVANTVKVWWILLSGGGGAGVMAVIAWFLTRGH